MGGVWWQGAAALGAGLKGDKVHYRPLKGRPLRLRCGDCSVCGPVLAGVGIPWVHPPVCHAASPYDRLSPVPPPLLVRRWRAHHKPAALPLALGRPTRELHGISMRIAEGRPVKRQQRHSPAKWRVTAEGKVSSSCVNTQSRRSARPSLGTVMPLMGRFIICSPTAGAGRGAGRRVSPRNWLASSGHFLGHLAYPRS